MQTSRWLICAGALILFAQPRPARACEPSFSVHESWPENGDVPSNGFAVFVGPNIRHVPQFFSVLADGQPVEFVISERLSSFGTPHDTLALRPLVPPPVGTSWSVTFEGEKKVVRTFTTTAPDLLPPAAPPASLHFDVHDFPGDVCSSCGNLAVSYWPHFADAAEDGGAPLVHVLYLGHPDADDDAPVAVRRLGPQEPFPVTLGSAWFPENTPVTEGVCFTLRILDLAGNEAASALRSCKPCHARIDPMQDPCSGAEPDGVEPAWTDADLVRGGACQAESAPPLPPEVFPEPEPGTTGEPDTGSDTGTGGMTTVDVTGDVTTADGTTAPTTDITTTDTASPTSGEDTTSTSGSSGLEPTSAGPADTTTTDGSSSDSNDTATAEPDKAICGCRGEPSSPAGLMLLLLAALRRRPRHRPEMSR